MMKMVSSLCSSGTSFRCRLSEFPLRLLRMAFFFSENSAELPSFSASCSEIVDGRGPASAEGVGGGS